MIRLDLLPIGDCQYASLRVRPKSMGRPTHPQYSPRIILIVRQTSHAVPLAGFRIEPLVRHAAVPGRRWFPLSAAHEI